MTPDQFLAQIRKQPPGPLYLFLGPENYRREMCRRALVERSVLWENTRVGPDVRLSECIVTGGMDLRAASHRGQIVTPRGVWPLA